MLPRAEREQEGGEEAMKVLHVIGAATLILAVAGLEGGALSFGQAIGILIGSMLVIVSTMKKTGWYDTKENAPAERQL